MAVYFCSDCGVRVFARQDAMVEVARCLRCMQGEGVSVEHLPEAVVVSFAGELDLARVDTFKEALDEALSSGREVEVDLGRCTFIDSSGLQALIRAFSSRNGDAGIAVTEASPAVRRVLELVGVDSYVTSS